jgi:hypothetical protein
MSLFCSSDAKFFKQHSREFEEIDVANLGGDGFQFFTGSRALSRMMSAIKITINRP